MRRGTLRKWRSVAAGMAALLLCPAGRTGAPIPGDPGLRTDAPADANRPYAQELSSSAAPNLFLALAGSVAISSTETHLPAWDSKIVGILGGSAFAIQHDGGRCRSADHPR